MMEHIKLFFNFLTNQPKNYLYYKEINIEKEEEEIEYEYIQEERVQPIKKEKRKKSDFWYIAKWKWNMP